jgi:hypothetical protein
MTRRVHVGWSLIRQLTAVAVLGSALAPLSLYAQTSRPTEYQIKAAYLYNFARFVTWPGLTPAPDAGPVTMCVLGEDPFGPVLDAAGTRAETGGRTTTVRRLTGLDGSENCRVLFISASEAPSLDKVIAALRDLSVLTVSDLPDFTRRGGIIQFVIEGNRVRFEVNLTAAETAGLTLSSELLKVAIAVRGTPRGGL